MRAQGRTRVGAKFCMTSETLAVGGPDLVAVAMSEGWQVW